MPLENCFAPTAKVIQLSEYEVPLADELILSGVRYGFIRRFRWTTAVHRYKDQRIETLPLQVIRRFEFILRFDDREGLPPDEMDDLEAFVDSHKGTAIPFFFVAPDTGETHVVRFSEDQVEIGIPTAVLRTLELKLIEVGDIDNSINNGLVYPDHVESTTTTTASTTTTSTT